MFIKNLIITGLVLLLASLLILIGYTKGNEDAKAKYLPIIAEYTSKVDNKLTAVETLASTLLNEGRVSRGMLDNNIATIIKNTKNKPLVIIKDGECNPSPTFTDSFILVNKQINLSMKEYKP